MRNAADPTEVTREITIAAPPEVVWTYLVEADKAARWMDQAAELDPRPGGLFRVHVLPGHTARGTFLELEPAGAAATRVRFSHRDLPSAAATRSHTEGWDHYLPRLVTAARGADPGRDPWLGTGA